MDLLNLSQPWDCERFPKSKTICYGGGSGGGDVKKAVKKVATATGYTGSDLDKAGQAAEKAVTGGVKKATETAKEVVVAKPPPILKKASEGFDQFGRRIKKGVSTGIENIKKEGNKAVTQIKTEAGKLAKGDFSLKNAVTGTVSGASETFKKSDAGKVVKKIAKETGYTGSDADKALQKTEKEVGNIGKQVLDVVNNPGKAVLDLADKGGKYVKRQLGVKVPTGKEALAQGVVSVGKALQKKPTETKAGPGGAVSIGGGKGLGSGAVQGLQGGAGMDTSRARAKQNKRKLRIR
tara:strand:- start:332 stop:1210 length:879 start_codon:yes stop_codon:yes gene_type:complete